MKFIGKFKTQSITYFIKQAVMSYLGLNCLYTLGEKYIIYGL
jgi:hypothetical protein